MYYQSTFIFIELLKFACIKFIKAKRTVAFSDSYFKMIHLIALFSEKIYPNVSILQVDAIKLISLLRTPSSADTYLLNDPCLQFYYT